MVNRFFGLTMTKKILKSVSLFYISIYIPIVFISYLPYWMQINCHWHSRCAIVGNEIAFQGIEELVRYFQHRDKLKMRLWSVKERQHLSEVRGFLEAGLGVFLISVLTLFSLRHQWDLRSTIRINLIVLACSTIILPFFPFFWRDVFHPLLFGNQLWMNTRGDFSYYLMPRSFFKTSFVLMIIFSCSLHLVIRIFCRTSKKTFQI